MTPKGANLEGSDLLEVSTLESGSYVTRSITGQEIIDAAASSGGVTAITATAPIESTGGTTPDISIRQSGSLDDGYLSSADWIAFNNKQDALTLTTTGTSGAATLVGATLNIPQYSGGGGGGGFNAEIPLGSGGIYSNIPLGNSSGNMNIGANNLYLMPFKPSVSFTTSNIFANVAVVGTGNSRLLLYSHSDITGLPDTKLFESVDISNTTIGIKTITTTLTFTAGTIYWFGIYSSSSVQFVGTGTAGLFQIGVDSSNSQYQNIQRSAVAFGTAPATFGTTHSKTQLSFVRIGLTAI